jgi:3-deoxy-D-manno-octulosonic-acid transferase
MWRAPYTLALYALLPLALIKLWWRGRKEPGYRRHLWERFGEFELAPERPVIWLHAVSVGEVRAAAPLVQALQARYADHELLVTCMTAAGREMLKQLYGESVLAAWLPYDFPAAMRRLLERFRPRIAVLMETELWPNMLAACREFGVPVVLANARLSEKSARGYAIWRGISRPAIASLAAVCAQSAEDGARLKAIGAQRLEVTGNLKFDAEPPADKVAAGRALRSALGARKMLLLASTREGEEALLLDALDALPADTLVAIVPRHPQRFDEVAALLAARGLSAARRSRNENPGPQHRLWLGDTMGEMAFYFSAADVAVIGGSFKPLGGQNFIEALACGTPVVLGPSVFNFAEAARLGLGARAVVQVQSAAEAMRTAAALLADDARRGAMARAGIALCAAHRGATERHLQVIEGLLSATDSRRSRESGDPLRT